MKKFIKNVFFTIVFIYLFIAAFATLCLLKTNDKGVTQFGKTSLVVMENDVENYFKKGDLVFMTKPPLGEIVIGEPIFFYDTAFNANTITLANVTKNVMVNDDESTLTVKDANGADKNFSSEYLIGQVNGSGKVPIMGSIIKTMTSRWGFLFLVIMPFLVAFLVEIYTIVKRVKQYSKEDSKEE